VLAGPDLSRGEAPTAAVVLERALAHHDPQNHWKRSRFRLELRETRPNGTERRTRIQFQNALDSFEILTDRDGHRIEGLLAGEDCIVSLDGSTEFTDAERDQFKLTCERTRWLRNYYTYLWGLPMKLRDPGTLIDEETSDVWYQKRRVWSVRVTYDEAVGSDIWYFYFDQETFALVGYRFFHDEAKNDGEYIVLAGETEVEGMRIPTRRTWYTNAEGRHLGDDLLVEIEVRP
jgi:hypothetical protein